MIIHNQLLKLNDNSSENIARTKELLLGMQGKIDTIRDLKVAPDIRRAETSYDLVLIAKFDSFADFQAYLPHPVHVEVATQLKSLLASAAAVCYED